MRLGKVRLFAPLRSNADTLMLDHGSTILVAYKRNKAMINPCGPIEPLVGRLGLDLINDIMTEVNPMNWDEIKGKWSQLQGQAKTRWAKLTDDDLLAVEGNKDQLVGKIQERYGITKEEAERQVDEHPWS